MTLTARQRRLHVGVPGPVSAGGHPPADLLPAGLAREAQRFSIPIRRCGWQAVSTPNAAPSTMVRCTSWTADLSSTRRKPCWPRMAAACWSAGWASRMGRDASTHPRAGVDPPDDLRARAGVAGGHPVSAPAARAGRPARRSRGLARTDPALAPMELAFDIAPNSTLGLDFAGALQLTVNRDGLRLSRRGLQTAEMHHRYWRGEARRLQILSTAPAWRFSSTMAKGDEQPLLPGYPGQLIFSGATPVAFCRWLLRPCMVE